MATMESWERWCSDVNMNPDAEWYQPELHVTGSTRPFRPAPVAIARPSPAAERPGPEGNFLAGFVYGMFCSAAIWFIVVVVALKLAGR